MGTYRFLSTAETIVPPYRFGVYDVLVLPPSFPYGGMVSTSTDTHICKLVLSTSYTGKRVLDIPDT